MPQSLGPKLNILLEICFASVLKRNALHKLSVILKQRGALECACAHTGGSYYCCCFPISSWLPMPLSPVGRIQWWWLALQGYKSPPPVTLSPSCLSPVTCHCRPGPPITHSRAVSAAPEAHCLCPQHLARRRGVELSQACEVRQEP